MASVPLLSSATEEAEEYDLLPVPSTSSSPHSQSRRRPPGSGSRLAWLPTVHTHLGSVLALAVAVAVVVGVVGGQILLPPSSFFPLFPPSSSSSEPFPPPNPFTLPGFLINRPVLPPDVDVNQPWGWYDKVRWKPIPSLKIIASEEGKLGRRERVGLEEDEEVEVEEGELPSLLEELKIAHETGSIPEGWSDWGVNKTILGIGDSIMRNNILYFTKHIAQDIERRFVPFRDELGSKWGIEQEQRQGVVDVPVIDLKMVNFFHQGMIESPVEGFYERVSLPNNFEEKLSKVFLPALDDPNGLNGRVPDLIIFESLGWDLMLLEAIAHNSGDPRRNGRPLDDIEMHFLRGRIVEVLGLVRRTFPTSKIVLQTPHVGAKPLDHFFSPIRNFQQAQVMTSVSLETGIELFTWGRIVSSLTNELSDGLHFRAGSGSWIWGEMVLYYLRQSALTTVSPPPPARKVPSSRVTQQDLIASYPQPKQDFKKPPGRRHLGDDLDSDSTSESMESATRLLRSDE